MTTTVADALFEDYRAYSDGRMTAVDLRRRLGNASYGDVLRGLADRDLPLPRAPTAGREAEIARARRWIFHADDDI